MMKKFWEALVRMMESRAAERQIAELDEHTLRDIGLEREAVRARADSPRRRLTFGLY